jgi:hypothetical protein
MFLQAVCPKCCGPAVAIQWQPQTQWVHAWLPKAVNVCHVSVICLCTQWLWRLPLPRQHIHQVHVHSLAANWLAPAQPATIRSKINLMLHPAAATHSFKALSKALRSSGVKHHAPSYYRQTRVKLAVVSSGFVLRSIWLFTLALLSAVLQLHLFACRG